MDRILEVAWQQQEKPFHAETIIPDDLIPISILRLILKSIVGHCEIYYPPSYSIFQVCEVQRGASPPPCTSQTVLHADGICCIALFINLTTGTSMMAMQQSDRQ
jgi:hypothetical protein